MITTVVTDKILTIKRHIFLLYNTHFYQIILCNVSNVKNEQIRVT